MGEGLTMLGNELFHRHRRSPREALDDVVRAAEEAVVVIGDSLAQMLKDDRLTVPIGGIGLGVSAYRVVPG